MFHEEKNIILEASRHNLLCKTLAHHVKFPLYFRYSSPRAIKFWFSVRSKLIHQNPGSSHLLLHTSIFCFHLCYP